MTGTGSESIPVRIVGGDDSHLWLESKSWNSVKKIPPGYSKEKTIRFSRRKDRVQVGLPISSLTEVSIDTDQKVPRKKSGRTVLQNMIFGACVGFTVVIQVVNLESEPWEEDADWDGDDGEAVLGLFGFAILGGTLGAVGYPIYDVVKTIEKINFRRKYPLAGSDGFRLEIRNR